VCSYAAVIVEGGTVVEVLRGRMPAAEKASRRCRLSFVGAVGDAKSTGRLCRRGRASALVVLLRRVGVG
jgi:hypothetical protein